MSIGGSDAGHRQPASHLLDAVTRAGAVAAATALALIVLAYSYEVTARYLFNAPTEWAHDLVSYLLAVIVFLAAPDVARTRGHVAIAFLLDRLGMAARSRAGRALAAVAAAVALAAGLIVAGEAVRQFDKGIVTIAVHPIPKWWITGVVAAGLVLTGLQFLRDAMRPRGR